MEEQIKTLEELQDLVNDSEGYMVGVTLVKEGTLNHYFFSNRFPFVDMLKSHSKVKDLILKQLEEDPRANRV